jgi:hypothetical protein
MVSKQDQGFEIKAFLFSSTTVVTFLSLLFGPHWSADKRSAPLTATGVMTH